MADEVTAFFSYSHEDMEFVDRLEADLRARGLTTWVDRRRLEGTHEWQPQIDRAIAQFKMVIAVVSPSALKSEYVQHEYQYAHQLRKRIVPVLCQPISVPLPSELAPVQWVDFVNKSGEAYEKALRELIDGCQDLNFDPTIDSRALYNQAHDLEGRDPERAAVLYQRLLNREPTYAGGRVQLDLERLNQQLYPQRAKRLRERAEEAHKQGKYGAEAGALEGLIALGDQAKNMYAWAKEYVIVAKQNRAWLDTYENVKHFVAQGDTGGARDLLTFLWRQDHAPYFRDPAGLAPSLGLKVPMTYEEAKEQRIAGERKQSREAQAESDRSNAIARADGELQAQSRQAIIKWEQACAFMQSDLSESSPEEITRSLKSLDALPSRGVVPVYVQVLPETWRKRQSASKSIATAQAEVYKAEGAGGHYDFYYLFLVGPLALCSLPAVCTAAGSWFGFVVGSGNGLPSGDVPPFWFVAGSTALAAVLVWLTIFTARRPRSHARGKLTDSQQVVDAYSKRAQQLCQEWLREAEPLHKERMRQLKEQRQRAINEAEARYQAQLPVIANEYTQALADITARYKST